MRDKIIIRQVGAALVSGYERLISREGGDAQGAGEIWAISCCVSTEAPSGARPGT